MYVILHVITYINTQCHTYVYAIILLRVVYISFTGLSAGEFVGGGYLGESLPSLFIRGTGPKQQGQYIHNTLECLVMKEICQKRLAVGHEILQVIEKHLITPYLSQKPNNQNKNNEKPVKVHAEVPIMGENGHLKYIDLLIRYTVLKECAVVEYKLITITDATNLIYEITKRKIKGSDQARMYARLLKKGKPPSCTKVHVYVGMIVSGVDKSQKSRMAFGLFRDKPL